MIEGGAAVDEGTLLVGVGPILFLSEEDVQLALWPTPQQLKTIEERHRLFFIVAEMQPDAELPTQVTPRVPQP
jgi:hypothetical protein